MDEIDKFFAASRGAMFTSLGSAQRTTAYDTLGSGAGSAGSGFLEDSFDAPTQDDLGGAYLLDTPNTSAGGKQVFVGPESPVGMNEGDIWLRG